MQSSFLVDINDLDIKVKCKNQYENYLKFLSNKRIISIVEKINYQCGRRTMKQKKIKTLIFLFNVRERTKRTLE